MALNNAAMAVAANALRGALAYAQIHSGPPGGSGTSNNHGISRQGISWSAVSGDGDFDLASPLEYSGLTPGATCSHLSLWSAASAGTYYGDVALSGDTTANSMGEFSVIDLDMDGSSS